MLNRRIAVAIVDDDVSVRTSLRRLCMACGLRADTYASGHEFIASLDHARERPDCLLVDAHMPGMTGMELHLQLRARAMSIPTIIFSADVTAATRLNLPAGIVEYLRKPVAGDDLLRAIDACVG